MADDEATADVLGVEEEVKAKVPLVMKEVVYCGVCGLPPDMCEYGSDFEKCKPWLIVHCPNLYPQLTENAKKTGAAKSADKSKGPTQKPVIKTIRAKKDPKEEEEKRAQAEAVARAAKKGKRGKGPSRQQPPPEPIEKSSKPGKTTRRAQATRGTRYDGSEDDEDDDEISTQQEVNTAESEEDGEEDEEESNEQRNIENKSEDKDDEEEEITDDVDKSSKTAKGKKGRRVQFNDDKPGNGDVAGVEVNESEAQDSQQEGEVSKSTNKKGDLKKKLQQQITIARVQRNKRKYVTVVRGLESCGIKLKDASKLFANKFSCGAAVVKGVDDEIDIQGDVKSTIVDVIIEKWKIPAEQIFYLEDGKNLRAARARK